MTQATREIDEAAFASLVAPHRRALHAHCYRMLGSVHDADDALQETLLGAWKGLPGFEGRSSVRSWLYTIATHASLRVLDGRRRRALPDVTGDAHDPSAPLGRPLAESVWIEPYPDEVERYEDRESVELAYVAALQLLAPNQRATLLLCEVLGFSARETADDARHVGRVGQQRLATGAGEARTGAPGPFAAGDAAGARRRALPSARGAVRRRVEPRRRRGDRGDAHGGRDLLDAAAADLVPRPRRHRGVHRGRRSSARCGGSSRPPRAGSRRCAAAGSTRRADATSCACSRWSRSRAHASLR